MNKHTVTAVASLALVALSGCQSESYMSSIPLTGANSRDRLVDSVRDTIDEQRACHTEFVQAHALLQTLQGAEKGDIERAYGELRAQVDECARSLSAFDERIVRVDEEAASLFARWEAELDEFQSDAMRRHSAERLSAAQSGFALVQEELTGVHGRMATLLGSHRDFVLYFNHNSTDASVEVLDQENERFRVNMETLERECRTAEADAEDFIHRVAGAPQAASQE